MFSKHIRRFFNRSPRPGDRKDTPMPEAQASQPAAPVAPVAPTVPDDLSSHLSTLIDAMRQLAESHKTLLETVRTEKGSGKQDSAPAPVPADPDISGDPGGGQRPGAV